MHLTLDTIKGVVKTLHDRTDEEFHSNMEHTHTHTRTHTQIYTYIYIHTHEGKHIEVDIL